MKYTKGVNVNKGNPAGYATVKKFAADVGRMSDTIDKMFVDRIPGIPDYYIKDFDNYKSKVQKALFTLTVNLWNIRDSLK